MTTCVVLQQWPATQRFNNLLREDVGTIHGKLITICNYDGQKVQYTVS